MLYDDGPYETKIYKYNDYDDEEYLIIENYPWGETRAWYVIMDDLPNKIFSSVLPTKEAIETFILVDPKKSAELLDLWKVNKILAS